MQKFHIHHETSYRYDGPVTLGEHRLLVRPRDGHDLHIASSRLDTRPAANVDWQRDELDNCIGLARFPEEQVTSLKIVSDVTVTQYTGVGGFVRLEPEAQQHPFQYEPEQRVNLAPWMNPPKTGKRFSGWLNEISEANDNTLDLLNSLCSAIYNQCEYRMRRKQGVQSPDETVARLRGSCRDYAWLFIAAARRLGIAARFVSGYLHTHAEHPHSHTHAWAEAYLPGAGWVGFDPTCIDFNAEDHIPVAVARLPQDVPPVSGVFFATERRRTLMTVKVKVTRLESE